MDFDYMTDIAEFIRKRSKTDFRPIDRSIHGWCVLNHLDSFLKSKYLCDVVIVSGDGERIPAHRVILAAASPVFSSMFDRDGFLESQQTDVALPNLTGSAIKALIEYSYSGRAAIPKTHEGVQDIYAAANYLQYNKLLEAVIEWLTDHVDVANCLSLCVFADLYDEKGLRNLAEGVVAKNIIKFFSDDEFLALPVQQFSRILVHKKLAVDSKRKLLHVVRMWVKNDEAARRVHVESLLKLVRLSMVKFRVSVYGLADLGLDGGGEDDRSARVDRDGVLLVAGSPRENDGNATTSDVLLYDPSSDTWRKLPSLKLPMARTRIAQSRGDIYAFGCHEEVSECSTTSDTVHRYNAETESWESIAVESRPRARHKIVACNDLVYCIGIGAANMCEVYVPERERWERVASCHQRPTGHFTMPAIGHQIFVLGFDETLYGCTAYNSLEDRWVNLLRYGVPGATVNWCYSSAARERIYVMRAPHCPASKSKNTAMRKYTHTKEVPDIEFSGSAVVVWDRRTKDISVGYSSPTSSHYGIAGDPEGERIYLVGDDQLLIYDERADKWDSRQLEATFKEAFNVSSDYDFECAVVDRKFFPN
ncbi:kelch-like protein 20 [Oscarella lobularis]|uniref:kelch-like protein 20 n=1 Tax=Oscarella lobularis TaxID=121494 RepID=UPI0033144E77